MPNYYKFIDKETGESPTLVQVDEEICAHFGVEPHPTFWFKCWEIVLGVHIACGGNLSDESLAKAFPIEKWKADPEPNNYKIAVFLREKYDTEAWYQCR